MDAPDHPTSPKEVELTEENDIPLEKSKKHRKRLIVDVEITFWTHVGWDGVLVILFSMGIAGLFVYITYLYTKRFQAWHRPGVWIFMVFAVLYMLLPLQYLFTWKKIAKSYSKNKLDKGNHSFVGQCLNFRNMFNINGVLFLWKLYFFEFIESINQIVNLVTVYLCALPVEATTSMSILFSTDAFYRAYQLRQPNTISRRDHQVKIDICIDFLCVAVPLCLLWFAYDIDISIPEMIQITVWPAICLFSKLRSILREIIRARTGKAIILGQTKISKVEGRDRKSIFREPNSVNISKQQQERMPKIVSTAFSVYNIVYGLFFLAVAIAHCAIQPAGCDETTWSKGCVNKIPFCGKGLFTPTCNCASLRIENDYSLTTLPDSLVANMTGLRKVFIGNCNLTKLPPRMEQLTEMVEFQILSNRLGAFDVDIRKWEKLDSLDLTYNKLRSFKHSTLWTHKNLRYLDISDNIGMELPDATTEISMPSLLFFACCNNSVNVPIRFDKNRFPNLLDLYLNGNHLVGFPDSSLKENLQYLGVARCNLKQLPSHLAEFNMLRYLDARDNNISVVNDRIMMLIKANQVESYFSGNAACNIDETLNCEPLCSKYCSSQNYLNDKFCHYECNSKECEYDGGDCL
eukprot:g2573.t1